MTTHRVELGSGLLASLTATLVLSIMMIGKKIAGVMPEMDPIGDLVSVAHQFAGLPESPLVGWALHFGLGVIGWGVLFAIFARVMPGPGLVKGLIFGIAAWLGMMVVFMPLAGHGAFAMSLGMAPAVMSFVLHIVFGAVLGAVFATLTRH